MFPIYRIAYNQGGAFFTLPPEFKSKDDAKLALEHYSAGEPISNFAIVQGVVSERLGEGVIGWVFVD